MGGLLTALYAGAYPEDLATITLIAPAGVECEVSKALVKDYKDSHCKKSVLLPTTEEEVVQALHMFFLKPPNLPRVLLSGYVQTRKPGLEYYHRGRSAMDDFMNL